VVKRSKKWLALALVWAMVLSLLPIPEQTTAAGEYFTFSDFSTDQNNPTQVNVKRVTLTGTFTGVVTSSITYRVDLIVNGKVISSRSGQGTTPIIENGNTFHFYNIELEQGLNKITVIGTNANGNQVEESCYVYFANVPAIHSVQLADGRVLVDGKLEIVDTPNLVLMAKAPNATNVTFNGVHALTGDGETFIATNIPMNPGYNRITVVASNDTQTYTVERQIVYYNGSPTAYDVKVVNNAGNPKTTSLDGNPTVGPNTTNGLQGTVEGVLLFKRDSTATLTGITLELQQLGNNTPPTVIDTMTTTVTEGVYDSNYIRFLFKSTTDLQINANGNYRIIVGGSYGTQSAAYTVNFKYRDNDTPYITEVREVYNPVVNGTTISYTSSGRFSSGTTILELPIWLAVKANNVSGTPAPSWSLEVWKDDTEIESPNFTYENYTTSDGDPAFKITQLPAGELELRIIVTKGSNGDTQSFALTYVPAPSIQLENVFNGQVFNENGPTQDAENIFSNVRGRLINFNLKDATERKSLKITINGVSKELETSLLTDSDGNYTGRFNFDAYTQNMTLVPGANTIVVSGVSGGVPVETRLTVYLLSSTTPIIDSLRPVPYDPLTPRFDDPTLKFVETDTRQYVTTEKAADILFSVQNVDTVIVQQDGGQISKASTNSSGTLVPDEPNLTVTEDSPNSGRYNLRVRNVQLPTSGVTSIVVTVVKGSSNASLTLIITRELSPYVVLSPKLPEERVINQNFVMVSIKAEGADQILINKEPMAKGEGDIFRKEVRDLKVGNNTIKFTILRGQEKLDGQFTINYVNQTIPGAQYKSQIKKSGKISVFNKQLEISLPKGTVLRKPDVGSSLPTSAIDLFDSQYVLFGIADKQDGRTIKRYNAVGQTSSSGPMDGTLVDILPNGIAQSFLSRPAHFGYASELYWIDAGYYDSTTSTEYHGMHPYERGNEFFMRPSSGLFSRMLVPTERGTITIKYDSNISDSSANTLGIWRLVDDTWVPLGGKVNTRNKTITAPFDGFGYYAVFQLRYTYNDIAGHPFARDHLNLMLSRGIMNAKSSSTGEFGSYDNITRGEFATMMVKILDLPLNYDIDRLTFDDVPPVDLSPLWDYRYIETAVRAGIVMGRAPRLFVPAGPITREEAAVMIARAMNMKLGTQEKDLPRLQKMFTDSGSIDYYAIPAVTAVARAGIIQGRPNTMTEGAKQTYRFDPNSYLSRAEAAIIAARMMDELGKL